ncbi:hypothetical protein HBI16_242420 [Parastagonospora nodorum]|nr:hypothetical protein HBI16_242420 [Parastagonospora nodorum]
MRKGPYSDAVRDIPGSESWLVINTDGSSFRNGKPDAIAGVGVYFGPNDKRNTGQPLGPGKQTNQRAELMAVKIALEKAPIDQVVLISSDSRYAINCLTDWLPLWKQRSWKKVEGIFKENTELIQSIVKRMETRQKFNALTYFWWVKGHSGDPGNEFADKLAVKGSKCAWGQRDRQQKADRRRQARITRYKTFVAIHLPVERRRIHYVRREEVSQYTQGSDCIFGVFNKHLAAAWFRDHGSQRHVERPQRPAKRARSKTAGKPKAGVPKPKETEPQETESPKMAAMANQKKGTKTVRFALPNISTEPEMAHDAMEVCAKA